MHRTRPTRGTTPARRTRTGRIAAGAAALLFALGPAGTATADELLDDGKRSGGETHGKLFVSPASGGAGTQVTVKATCQPSGGATSVALREPITLKRVDGQWVGTGHIRSTGLQPGRVYQINVNCADGRVQTGNFTYTATPSGGAAAGFGGAAGGDYTTALAIGGGIAAAGALGYVFTSRRRALGRHGF
ncbi:hypothetical protein FNQ90_20865 [Streptomyces alkaliphilus]|uniref:LPXTG cell wall anchor domain-containing protein n=1 Tax=Streptomyces alkaliphilus TaxID=1472722 RepID=A0A7W3THA0_9ACTN|nr:hypothetical protein [Streptomyces alkaliphilus]MBB0246495.1 hypothetical protein [Streptomyces alkaliphilus]